MDQGYVSTSAGRFVRLALIFFAAVFGLILLTFAFGSSPASADDGGPDDGGLVPAGAALVGGALEAVAPVAQAAAAIPLVGVPLSSSAVTASVAAVAHAPHVATISQPVSGAVDGTLVKVLGQTVVGDALGTAPVDSVLGPVAEFVDSTVEVIGGVIAPVLGMVPGLVATVTSVSVDAATASLTSAGAATLPGTANGAWRGDAGSFGNAQPGASSVSLTTTFLPAAALGAAFFVLLVSRRLGLVNSTLPVSPVYETDTSPD